MQNLRDILEESGKLTRARRGGISVLRALGPKLTSVPNIADAAWSAAATPPNASSHRCSAILPPKIFRDNKNHTSPKKLNFLTEWLRRNYMHEENW